MGRQAGMQAGRGHNRPSPASCPRCPRCSVMLVPGSFAAPAAPVVEPAVCLHQPAVCLRGVATPLPPGCPCTQAVRAHWRLCQRPVQRWRVSMCTRTRSQKGSYHYHRQHHCVITHQACLRRQCRHHDRRPLPEVMLLLSIISCLLLGLLLLLRSSSSRRPSSSSSRTNRLALLLQQSHWLCLCSWTRRCHHSSDARPGHPVARCWRCRQASRPT